MMEREQNFGEPRLANLNVGEPHFNDERTILTARPVVPLKVFSRILTRRWVALVGAFVLAALLGAGTALAIIELRQPRATNPLEVSDREEIEEQPVAEVSPAEDESKPTGEMPAVSGLETETGSVMTRKPTRSSRTGVSETAQSTPKVTVSIKTNDSQPQARLIDEWQERRQRRVRTERPNNHHKRDLFRIREIFEGPRPE